MSILDLLKKNRGEEDEDEESGEDAGDNGGDDEDEDQSGGGLVGRLVKLRGIGVGASGMLGKVLKRGGDDDEEEDDDDDDDEVEDNAPPVRASVVAVPDDVEESAEAIVADLLDVAGEPDEPDGPEDESLLVETGADDEDSLAGENDGESSEFRDVFAEKADVVDQHFRDLAMSQDDISSEQLLEDLNEVLKYIRENTSVS